MSSARWCIVLPAKHPWCARAACSACGCLLAGQGSGAVHAGHVRSVHAGHVRPVHAGHVRPVHAGHVRPVHAGHVRPVHAGHVRPVPEVQAGAGAIAIIGSHIIEVHSPAIMMRPGITGSQGHVQQ
jgi:hypothetical protein